ncbi:MAG: hypothetical protein BGO26_06400 [Actinobacteria bacterium 69-20]|nr:hypothetical protein [Actinomycetota bacterium]OJV28074.1 MAG: hypothetical protein BGO26_06400 [Actinobacteria bacterium 69-20]
MVTDDLDLPPSPSGLEERYRRLLRVLPRPYRVIREEEMVDVFLQERVDADPDSADLTLKFGVPGPAESWSVLQLAMRARFATTPERARAQAQAVRVATLGGLVVLAVQAIDTAWARLLLSEFPMYRFAQDFGPAASWSATPGWVVVQEWLPAAWIVVLLAALIGQRALGQLVGAATIVATLVIAAVSGMPVADSPLMLILKACLVAGLAAVASHAPPARRGLWITAATTGAFAVAAMTTIAWFWPPARDVIGWVFANVIGTGAGFWCMAAAAAAFALLVLRSLKVAIPTGVILGVCVFSTVALLTRVESLITWLSVPPASGARAAITPAAAQLIIVAAITLTAAIIGTTRYRRLPARGEPSNTGPHISEDQSRRHSSGSPGATAL